MYKIPFFAKPITPEASRLAKEMTIFSDDKADLETKVQGLLLNGWLVKYRRFSLDDGHSAVLVRKDAA